MELLHNLAIGFGVALTPANLFFALAGALIGTLIGVLPGIGPIATIAMLLPLTFHLEPTSGLIMLAGIFYGAQYGGSTTAILVNLPGETSSVVTCIDGHQMARQGRAGAALAVAALGLVLRRLRLDRADRDVRAAARQGRPVVRRAGIFLADGARPHRRGGAGARLGDQGDRHDHSRPADRPHRHRRQHRRHALHLRHHRADRRPRRRDAGDRHLRHRRDHRQPGAGRRRARSLVTQKITRLWPTREDFQRAWPAVLRGTALGSVLGVLPGGGATLSVVRRLCAGEEGSSKHPAQFGHGAVEGVAGPESANNAGAQTSFIPMLTLGIPGNAVMALMIGALTIHGIQPGPQIMTERPGMFWGMIASMWIGNLMLVIINLPLIGMWVQLLKVPYRFLYLAILLFCGIGVYTVNNSSAAVLLAAFFGVLGYVFMRLECEPAPMILGFVLGPLMEENLRRAMRISSGDPMIFLNRPISLGLLIAALALCAAGRAAGDPQQARGSVPGELSPRCPQRQRSRGRLRC